MGNDVLLRCFRLCDSPALGVRDIESAYGYGGPLSTTADPEFLSAARDAFTQWARARGVLAEFLRFHPLVPHERWYSGDVAFNRTTVHVDLAEDLFQQYPTRTRTCIRQYRAGGLAMERVSSEVMRSVFPGMYESNMEHAGASSEYHFPLRYLEALFEFCECDNWLVFMRGKPVAGAVVLASSVAGVAEYHLSARVLGLERSRAMPGLIHGMAEYYQSRSFRYLYLGGGRSVGDQDSLLFFKKGFSQSTAPYRIGHQVFAADVYDEMRVRFPERAASGRVLFYRD
ncbi:MAG: hypothetical protein Q8P50_18465 [Bacillota bacterium]|nr:hypothetical protein [Bacillota bacterium]